MPLGTLTPGAAADVSVFRLAQGEWTFRDSSLEEETSGTRLEPMAVVRAGRVSACTPAAYLKSSVYYSASGGNPRMRGFLQAEHAPPGPADHDPLGRCAGTALRAERGSASFYPPNHTCNA